jgi:parallel beta-helix repeat protein
MKNSRMEKCLAVGIILLFVGTYIIPVIAQDTEKSLPTSRGTWLYVGGSGPGNFSTIQDAIDHAYNGNTIFVYNGTYNEHLTIDKQINLIGEDRETTIINGDYAYESDIVYVTSNQVLIQGFTIQHADIYSYCLLFVDCSHHTISDCHFFENKRQAIMLLRSSNNTISHCTITECKIGIVINNEFSDNNIISDCYIATENQGVGVGSAYNLISNCTLLGGEMTLTDGTNNSILNCHIANQQGSFGIQLGYTTNNTFRNNSLEHCGIVFHCNFPYEFYQDIDTSNIIDGKPIYYLRNESNREMNESMNPGYIILVSCRNITIRNITCHGITIGDTSFSSIENCSFFENILGVDIWLSSNTIISNCSFSYDSAISIRKSSHNIVKQCTMPNGSPTSFGIDIDYYSYNNTICDCDIENYPIGICISGASQQNTIIGCSISHSRITGLWLIESENTITKCHIYDNEIGITLWNSYNLIILNNFINNHIHANTTDINTWDNGSAGNYWSDYHCFDLNGDGIGELPYRIGTRNKDQKPLMQPFQKIISKPSAKYLYINDNTGVYIRLTPFGNALILGGISIDVIGNDWVKVEFYVDNDLKNIDTEPPFQWIWNERGLSKHTFGVVAHSTSGNSVIDEINSIII